MGMKDDYEPVDVPQRIKGQEVSLGCGTLILIALIVSFFSNRGMDDVEREVRELRVEISELRVEVSALREDIQSLTHATAAEIDQ